MPIAVLGANRCIRSLRSVMYVTVSHTCRLSMRLYRMASTHSAPMIPVQLYSTQQRAGVPSRRPVCAIRISYIRRGVRAATHLAARTKTKAHIIASSIITAPPRRARACVVVTRVTRRPGGKAEELHWTPHFGSCVCVCVCVFMFMHVS